MTTDILASSRRKKRKKIFWKAGLIMIVTLFLLGGAVAFFYIPKFRISEISVESTGVLDKDQLKGKIINILEGKFFRIVPYNNIFVLPQEKITAELLRDFPVLRKVSVSRNFFQKISVSVEERKPEALWCLGQIPAAASTTGTELSRMRCAFADGQGFIFQPAPIFSGTIFPKFSDQRQEPAAIGKQMIPDSEFQKILSFRELLEKNGINVVRIVLKDGEIYEIYLKEGWYVLLNSKNEPNPAFNNLELVLEMTIKDQRPKLEYIDLRFGQKVFFKYK